MFVSVEPAEMFMYLVKLFFDQENPDSEDAEAKSYLKEHDLEPRYLWSREGSCLVCVYGGESSARRV